MSDHTSLLEITQHNLTAEHLQLPIFHPIAQQLHATLTKDGSSINQVAALMTEDPTLASHILRAANSAFFVGLKKTTTVREAIVRLGAKKTTQLAVLFMQQDNARSSDKIIGMYSEALWKHARGCAMGTKWLAERLGYEHLSQEAFLAGLLHDIGKLFLLKVFEDIHAAGTADVSLSRAVILEVMESLHAEQGYRLLQQWNLPEMYCNIVRDHHKEDFDTNNELLTMVRLVNLACRKVGIGMQHDPAIVLAATPEAQSLETTDILLAELEIMIEDALELAS